MCTSYGTDQKLHQFCVNSWNWYFQAFITGEQWMDHLDCNLQKLKARLAKNTKDSGRSGVIVGSNVRTSPSPIQGKHLGGAFSVVSSTAVQTKTKAIMVPQTKPTTRIRNSVEGPSQVRLCFRQEDYVCSLEIMFRQKTLMRKFCWFLFSGDWNPGILRNRCCRTSKYMFSICLNMSVASQHAMCKVWDVLLWCPTSMMS